MGYGTLRETENFVNKPVPSWLFEKELARKISESSDLKNQIDGLQFNTDSGFQVTDLNPKSERFRFTRYFHAIAEMIPPEKYSDTNTKLEETFTFIDGIPSFLRESSKLKGTDVYSLWNIVRNFATPELHVLMARNIVERINTEATSDTEKVSLAKYLLYVYSPLMRVYELPEEINLVEETVLKTLFPDEYLKANQLWLEKFGCEYNSTKMEEETHNTSEKLVESLNKLKKPPLKLISRKKSLLSFLLKERESKISGVIKNLEDWLGYTAIFENDTKLEKTLDDVIAEFTASGYEVRVSLNPFKTPLEHNSEYRTIHLLLNGNDLVFPIEIRIVCVDDYYKNIQDHIIYKKSTQTHLRKGEEDILLKQLGLFAFQQLLFDVRVEEAFNTSYLSTLLEEASEFGFTAPRANVCVSDVYESLITTWLRGSDSALTGLVDIYEKRYNPIFPSLTKDAYLYYFDGKNYRKIKFEKVDSNWLQVTKEELPKNIFKLWIKFETNTNDEFVSVEKTLEVVSFLAYNDYAFNGGILNRENTGVSILSSLYQNAEVTSQIKDFYKSARKVYDLYINSENITREEIEHLFDSIFTPGTRIENVCVDCEFGGKMSYFMLSSIMRDLYYQTIVRISQAAKGEEID